MTPECWSRFINMMGLAIAASLRLDFVALKWHLLKAMLILQHCLGLA